MKMISFDMFPRVLPFPAFSRLQVCKIIKYGEAKKNPKLVFGNFYTQVAPKHAPNRLFGVFIMSFSTYFGNVSAPAYGKKYVA